MSMIEKDLYDAVALLETALPNCAGASPEFYATAWSLVFKYRTEYSNSKRVTPFTRDALKDFDKDRL